MDEKKRNVFFAKLNDEALKGTSLYIGIVYSFIEKRNCSGGDEADSGVERAGES